MRDYAFPQGLGLLPAQPTGLGASLVRPSGVPQVYPVKQALRCPAGYTWVSAYPPAPTSPHVPQLTAELLSWIGQLATAYPQNAASDGEFYYHLGTPTGMSLRYSQGFNSLSVCVSKSSYVASQRGGSAPIIVAGTPGIRLNPALTTINPLLAGRGAVPVAAVAPDYTWLYVLLGLGVAGVAGYYLLD